MSKLTPGPWHIDETKALGAYGVWTDYATHPGHDGAGYGSQICSMLPDERKDRAARDADAKLIAAAPDLLAALSEIVRGWDSVSTHAPVPEEINVDENWEAARNAIAKALGKTASS